MQITFGEMLFERNIGKNLVIHLGFVRGGDDVSSCMAMETWTGGQGTSEGHNHELSGMASGQDDHSGKKSSPNGTKGRGTIYGAVWAPNL